jgi:SP family myo-inositol transporter-like MFS transporter 13
MLGQTGYNSLLYYSGTVFSLLGFKNGAAAGLIVSGGNALFVVSAEGDVLFTRAAELTFQFVGRCIVDRMGRRRLLVVAVPFLIAGLVWASISFHFLTLSTGGVLLKDATYSPAVAGSLLGAIVCFVVFFGVSLSHVIWYQSEFFSLEIRAAGSALATTSCWLANLVIAVSYLSLMEKLTPAGTYGLYTGFCVIGYIFVLFCYPETSESGMESRGKPVLRADNDTRGSLDR